MADVQKICCVCSADVSGKKRVKDPRGQYYCEACYAARKQTAASPAAEKPAEDEGLLDLAPVAKKAGPPPAPVAEDEGELGLAEPIKAGAPAAPMFACAGCKKLVSEKYIRNDDGEFLCGPCFAQRHPATKGGAAVGAKPKAGKLKTEEFVDENPETWAHTIAGGLAISAGVLVLSFVVWMAMHMGFKSPDDRLPDGVGGAAVYATIETIAVVLGTGALMVSMVIAARILGGIDFGYIGSALWKALAAILAYSVFNAAMNHFESLSMIAMGFRIVVLMVTFVVFFKIDYFEAMLLTVVNWLLLMAISIGMIGVLSSLAPKKPMPDDDEGAPAFHGRPAPAAAPDPGEGD